MFHNFQLFLLILVNQREKKKETKKFANLLGSVRLRVWLLHVGAARVWELHLERGILFWGLMLTICLSPIRLFASWPVAATAPFLHFATCLSLLQRDGVWMAPRQQNHLQKRKNEGKKKKKKSFSHKEKRGKKMCSLLVKIFLPLGLTGERFGLGGLDG
jgi:hypothetical protein